MTFRAMNALAKLRTNDVSSFWVRPFYYPLMSLKTVGLVKNSVDLNHTPSAVASDLGFYLFAPACPDT